VQLADVNPFIYAHRPESANHEDYRDWLAGALCGPEPFGVSELVLAGFLRIVTNHRVYRDPTPPDLALTFCAAVRAAPAAVAVRAGPDHWDVFVELCRSVGARANVVPDAFHAALAIEHGATWLTTDRAFARFPGLRWQHPLDAAST